MVPQSFSSIHEKIKQLQINNDIIQKTKPENLNPGLLKITTKLSIELINDLFIEYNKNQEKILQLETQLNEAITRYNKDVSSKRELWIKLKEIFQKAQLICEIASQESQQLRSNEGGA